MVVAVLEGNGVGWAFAKLCVAICESARLVAGCLYAIVVAYTVIETFIAPVTIFHLSDLALFSRISDISSGSGATDFSSMCVWKSFLMRSQQSACEAYAEGK